MKYKLTKIKDEKFNGEHPNGINEGYEEVADKLYPIVVGEPYIFGNLRTSTVMEIININTFRTKNSIYKIGLVD